MPPSDPRDLTRRLLARRRLEGDCWLYEGATDAHGCGLASFAGRTVRVHLLAAYLWLGRPLDAASYVGHRCGRRNCFNPAHLTLAASRAYLAQLHPCDYPKGARHPRPKAKLTLAQACQVKAWQQEGRLTPLDMAAQLGAPLSSVWGVLTGRTWRSTSP
jgi:hypothetical protein